MRILMLGWEYPPHISGGLGTACQGLTTALASLNVALDFVVPAIYGDEPADHMNLIDCSAGVAKARGALQQRVTPAMATRQRILRKVRVPAFLAPYWTEQVYEEEVSKLDRLCDTTLGDVVPANLVNQHVKPRKLLKVKQSAGYAGDLFSEIERYAANVVAIAADREFDIIHAHDWITFPAAIALARLTGKPFVAHVHSLESDRSNNGGSPRITGIERQGVKEAQRVIAVSAYTGRLVEQQHGVPASKIRVVHNGMVVKERPEKNRQKTNIAGNLVLFLGRVTYQKGPEYFVEAAHKVLSHCPDTTFVLAGNGDLLPALIQRVNSLGMNDRFIFTGFLKGRDVDEMFAAADLYIMPSVSEPFGLTALEAIACDTPVILSRTSGVSEVLQSALKFDFWDVQKLADLIVNCLQHRALRDQLLKKAKLELADLGWDQAAFKTQAVYHELLAFKQCVGLYPF